MFIGLVVKVMLDIPTIVQWWATFLDSAAGATFKN